MVFLGWSPLVNTADASPLLRFPLEHLTNLRKFLGLPFAGLWVWQPAPEDLENLRFRRSFRDIALLQEILREGNGAWFDIAHSNQDPDLEQPANLIEAQAELLESLAMDRMAGRLTERIQAAREAYETLVEEELIAPLQGWALASADPVIRNAGMELASVCRQLHQIGPALHELQTRQWNVALTGAQMSSSHWLFEEYLQLGRQLGSITRDIQKWQSS